MESIERTVRNPRLWGPIVLIGLVVLAFSIARHVSDAPAAISAQGTVEPELGWVRELQADRDLERLDKTIAGVRIGPDVDVKDRLAWCASEYVQSAEPNRGGALSAVPSVLPPNVEFVGATTLTCGDEVVAAEVNYSVPSEPSTQRLGGGLLIYRYQGERVFQLDVPAKRAEVTSVRGREAVIVRPVTSGGHGLSAILINEPWGLTVVRATGMGEAELLRISESLSDGAEQ